MIGPDVNSRLIGKDPDAGKDWRQKEKRASEDEMAVWHHRCNGHELGQIWEMVRDRLAWVLQSMGLKESDTTGWWNDNDSTMIMKTRNRLFQFYQSWELKNFFSLDLKLCKIENSLKGVISWFGKIASYFTSEIYIFFFMIITKYNFVVQRWVGQKEAVSVWNTCLILKPLLKWWYDREITATAEKQSGGEKSSRHWTHSGSFYLRWWESVLRPLGWIRVPKYYKKGIPGKKRMDLSWSVGQRLVFLLIWIFCEDICFGHI